MQPGAGGYAMSVQVYIDAVGVIGPGASDWPAWRGILRDEPGYQAHKTLIPALNVLPSAERRRVGTSVKIALACGLEALTAAQVDPSSITTVFSSSGGDGENCHWICEALAGEDRLISPTRFHNSVHNAPSGYWGIASGSMLPSTSLCAFDASFAAGLLEAAVQCSVQKAPVLLVVYDTPYPEPLNGARPISDQFAVSLLMTPLATARTLTGIALKLDKTSATSMGNPELERVRSAIPAARSLPMLRALAKISDLPAAENHSDVYIEYLNRQSLCVTFFR